MWGAKGFKSISSDLHDDKLVLEEGIDGMEVECAVLGNEKPKASTVGEDVSKRQQEGCMRRQRRSITDIICENCKYLPTKRARNKRKLIPKESDVKTFNYTAHQPSAHASGAQANLRPTALRKSRMSLSETGLMIHA